jgi:hypothetical protein
MGAGIAQSIETGYGLYDRGVRVRVPVWSKNFLLYVVQTDSRAHTASYPKDTGGLFPGVKQPGREDDHSPPAFVEAKKI